MRAIRLLSEKKPLDGYEAEVSQEIAHRTGKDPQGFFIPPTLRAAVPHDHERRALDTTAGAGALVTNLAPTMIDLLRNRMRIAQLGATVLDDLVGTLDIPKQTGTGTSYWVTEGNAPTGSDQAIGQVELAPSTQGAYTDYTRRFVKQTSVDVENFARADLTAVLALEKDRVCINGSGTGAEPEGVLQNSNIETIAIGANGGPITWAKLVELETQAAIDNAIDDATLAYLTNAKVIGDLKTIEKASGTARFLMENGEANGYQVARSNQVPSDLDKGTSTGVCSAMIFGDFSTILIGMWGGIDVLVDPYALSTSGGVRIVLLQDTQVKYRHEEALKKIADLTTDA